MSEASEPVTTKDKEKDAAAARTARVIVEAIDFEMPARSAVGAWVRIAALVLSTYAFLTVLRTTVSPLLIPTVKTPLNGDEYEGHRYGMTLEERKAIFADLAA